jgi:hypothetical protein
MNMLYSRKDPVPTLYVKTLTRLVYVTWNAYTDFD